MANILYRYSFELFLVTLLLVLVFLRGSTLGDPGVGWHLKTGELIASHWDVPRVDPFLSGSGDTRWVADQWLSDLFLYGCYTLGGFALLHLVSALLPLFTYGYIVGRDVLLMTRSFWLFLPVMSLVVVLASVQWFLRPVLFSFLYFALVYRFLRKLKPELLSGKRLFISHIAFFAVFATWANLHPGFPIGLSLFAIKTVDVLAISSARARLRHSLVVIGLFVTSVAATFVNPYGYGLHQSILALVSDPYFMTLNNEWLAPDYQNPFFWPFYLSAGISLLFAGIRFRRLTSRFDVMALILFLWLSFSQRRYIPFYSVPFAYFVAQVLAEYRDKASFDRLRAIPGIRILFGESADMPKTIGLLTPMLVIALLISTVLTKSLPGVNQSKFAFERPTIDAAIQFIADSKREGVIFANPNYGGYIVWHLWPRIKPFIDDRNIVSGKKRYETYFQLRDAKADVRELIDDQNFSLMLIDAEDKLNKSMQIHPGWRQLGGCANNNSCRLYFRQHNSPMSVLEGAVESDTPRSNKKIR